MKGFLNIDEKKDVFSFFPDERCSGGNTVFDEEDFNDYEVEVAQPIIQHTEGVEKLKINFEDNPLRADTRREPPPAKVEETFIKGGEIKDDLSI